jgi:NADPH-dependent 2,4-dienoyl-CoA reductase/sulfur reductase-like enzyme
MFCGMGVCFGFSVRVNGVENVCACRQQVHPEDIIETGRDPGRISDDILKVTEFGSLPARDSSLQEPEIAVVGGEPAGLCAALTAARAGADVVLLDEGQQLGGQIYKQPCKSFQFSAEQLADKKYLNGRRLISEVLQGRIRVVENALVWGASR